MLRLSDTTRESEVREHIQRRRPRELAAGDPSRDLSHLFCLCHLQSYELYRTTQMFSTTDADQPASAPALGTDLDEHFGIVHFRHHGNVQQL